MAGGAAAPLSGPALAGPTHLQLIVGGTPPFIVDVDAGTLREVPGIVGAQSHATLWVMPSRGGALAGLDLGCYPCAAGVVGVRIRADGSVRRLARGRSVAPARSSSALWLLRGSSKGTLVAVAFGDPAYPGPAQAQDIWILDSATGAFTHLPGFPAQVDLKFSSLAWTPDDRLVLIMQGGGRTVLAVWRPGSRTLPLRPLQLPERSGGSDTFVPLVG